MKYCVLCPPGYSDFVTHLQDGFSDAPREAAGKLTPHIWGGLFESKTIFLDDLFIVMCRRLGLSFFLFAIQIHIK